jgi:hypothetical protein
MLKRIFLGLFLLAIVLLLVAAVGGQHVDGRPSQQLAGGAGAPKLDVDLQASRQAGRPPQSRFQHRFQP